MKIIHVMIITRSCICDWTIYSSCWSVCRGNRAEAVFRLCAPL